MKVKELIEILKTVHGDKDVLSQSSGDIEDLNEIVNVRSVFGNIVLEIKR